MLKLFSKRSDSKDIAFERLNRALVKDRTNCSCEMIEGLGEDILSAVSNYMEYDRSETDIHISREEGEENPVLYAKIPIITLFNESK
ncbi:MAG: cell division topological specificity factor MinE [Clostridiales bacterium]|nr:cell division topological specificity factor MinE [Clostridiales bacterium]MCD8157581.1 cell division topological specificity factor MinE [Clostridiales bacterium]